MRLREFFGAVVFVAFLALFVYMMNTISAPNAKYELGNYVIVADLIIGIVFIMIFWGPLVNGEPFLAALPLNIPSYVGIPIGVAVFVFFFVSSLGEILLHVNEIISPAVALLVAACILGGATLLDHRSPHPEDAFEMEEADQPEDAPVHTVIGQQDH